MSNNWSEKELKDRIIGVFDYYDIEYETETPLESVGDSTGSTSRIDIYVPKTDTAIELKGPSGNLDRGVGQALNYSRVCKEAILALDGEANDSYRQDIHRTCQIAPAVHFAMIIPNPTPSASGAGLDVSTDSRPDLFHEMLYNREWNDDVAVLKPLIPEYVDHEEKRWARPVGNQSINAYQQHGKVKKSIMRYIESANAPVSLEGITEHIYEEFDDYDKFDSRVHEAFRSLCRERRIIKLDDQSYVERFSPES